jgi:ubiquinone/menaquinone biosynthesis C-methylase UbiE
MGLGFKRLTQMPAQKGPCEEQANPSDDPIEQAAQSWKDGFIYHEELGKNTVEKAALVLRNLPHLDMVSTGRGMRIVDIGCAGGDVLAAIHHKLPQALVIGIDIKQKAITDSQKKLPEGRFYRIDIRKDKLPIRSKSVDVVNMSSVCHELIDFRTKNDKHAIMVNTLNEMRRILKSEARLIIREPTLPKNPVDKIILTISKTQVLTKVRARVSDAYANLTEAELFEKFVQEWIYLKDTPIQTLPSPYPEQQACYAVPAWVVAEYARKRTFTDYIGNWQSEMQEQNALFTPQDMQAYAVEAGFKPENIQFRTLMEDGFYGEFKEGDGITLTDQLGEPIDQATTLPSHMYMILKAE